MTNVDSIENSGLPGSNGAGLPSRRGAVIDRIRSPAIVIASATGLVALWALASSALGVSVLFPSPATVAHRAFEMIGDGSLFDHARTSLVRILAGFVIGVAIGVPVGLIMGSVQTVRDLLEPFVEFFRFIPALALVTLALIWFGPGEASKIFLIVYTSTAVMVVNSIAGVKSIPVEQIRAARSMGAKGMKLFLRIKLPAAVPSILTGMRIAMGISFSVIVAAEMVAAQSGIGFLIFSSRLFMATDAIFVGIVSLGIMGYTTDRILRFVTTRFFGRYLPEDGI